MYLRVFNARQTCPGIDGSGLCPSQNSNTPERAARSKTDSLLQWKTEQEGVVREEAQRTLLMSLRISNVASWEVERRRIADFHEQSS